jgi:hypothetical protein
MRDLLVGDKKSDVVEKKFSSPKGGDGIGIRERGEGGESLKKTHVDESTSLLQVEMTTTGPVISLMGKVPLSLSDVAKGKVVWIPVNEPLPERVVVMMEKGTQFEVKKDTSGNFLFWMFILLLLAGLVYSLYSLFQGAKRYKKLSTEYAALRSIVTPGAAASSSSSWRRSTV